MDEATPLRPADSFESQLEATLASLARWNAAERELAQARLDMARDVREILA